MRDVRQADRRPHPPSRGFATVLWLAVCALAGLARPLAGETMPSLEGRVFDAEGQPLPALLELLPAQNPEALAETQRRQREAEPVVRRRTSGQGHYRLEVPRPGVYGLRISAPGHLAVRHDLAPLVRDRELSAARLPRAEMMGIEVVDPEALPVLGIQLVARPWSTFWRQLSRRGWWPETRWAVADEKGRARLPCGEGERLKVVAATLDWIAHHELDCSPGKVVRLEPNGYWLPARIDRHLLGFEGRLIGFYRWPLLAFGDSDDDDVFWLPVSGDGTPLSIWLADSLGSFGQPVVGIDEEKPDLLWVQLPENAVIEGKIHSAVDGRPLAGAWVHLGRGGHLFTTTDEGGAFRLRLPLDDETPLRFAAAGHVSDSGPTPRAASELGALEIVLAPQTVLRGRVLDPEGWPVPGASLVLESRSRPTPSLYRATSDAEGGFALHGLAPGTEYQLRITARGFRPFEEILQVEDGLVVERQLERARRIYGQVIDERDRPLDGATVELVEPLRGVYPETASAPTVPWRASTGPVGGFELFDVSAGRYFLVARAPGYPELAVPGVEIPEGEASVDLGTVVLSPGVVVRGRVVDRRGRSVVGARVSARRADSAELVMRRSASPWFANRQSRARGEFTLESIPTESRLVLLVSAEGHLPWQEELEVGRDDLELEVTLEPSAAIRGLVLGHDGMPTRARVEAVAVSEGQDAEQRGRARDLGLDWRMSECEADGSFELGPLVEGRYELRARAGDEGSAGLTVDLGPEGLEGLVLRLEPLAQISGRAFVAGEDGRVGPPLAGGHVHVAPEQGYLARSALQPVDALGVFVVDGLLPGVYRLSLRHPDFENGPVERVRLEGPVTGDVQLLSGPPRRPLASVSGRVVDSSGRAVAGARIHLIGDFPAWNHSDSEGRFVLETRVGEARLQARHPEHGTALGDPFELGPEGRSGLRLELTAALAAVRGRVSGLELDDLARVSLVAQGPFERVWGVLDWEGAFILDQLDPGAWTLEARLGDAGRLLQYPLVLEPGEDREGVELVFIPGHRIRGTALYQGQLLSEGRVTAECEDGSRSRARVGRDGRFELADVSEGSCVLRLETDVGTAEQRLEVVGDIETWIELDP